MLMIRKRFDVLALDRSNQSAKRKFKRLGEYR